MNQSLKKYIEELQESGDFDDISEELITRVQRRVGLDTKEQTGNVIKAVLVGIGAALYDEDRRVFRMRLPLMLSAPLFASNGREVHTVDGLFERVSWELDVELNQAREITMTVTQALGRTLTMETLTLLQSRLPGGIPDLLERTPETRMARNGSIQSTVQGGRAEMGRTLASGRPGSQRPLSESVPGHRDSVSVNPSPREDRKISTSDGTASTGEPLSTGRLGSQHPL